MKERIELARRALSTLEELARIEDPSAVERDAAIQRFEYSFEAVWRAAQLHLDVVEGIVTGSPKGCVRSCREAGLLGNEDATTALEMVDDRNRTVHTYNEAVALEIFGRLRRYAGILRVWLEAIEERQPPAPESPNG